MTDRRGREADGAIMAIAAVGLSALLFSIGCSRDPAAESRTHLLKGDNFARAGKFQEAAIEYRNAIKYAPTSTEGHAKLADAAAHANDPKTALLEYLKIADLDPANAAAQVRAASVYLLAGRYDDARDRAEAAVEQTPGDAAAHLALGEALAGLHDRTRSLESFTEAVRLAPGAPEPHISLGSAYWAAGRLEDAEKELNRATALAPSHLGAHRALGLFLMATNRMAAAESHWKAVAQAPFGDPFALADYYLVANRPADAERELRPLTGAAATRHGAWLRLGALQFARGDLDDALASATSGQSDAKDPAAGTMIGMLLEAKDRRADAQAEYEATLSKFPTAGIAANNLAWLYVENGRLDDALKWAGVAERAIPRRPEVHDTLGWIYLRRGEAGKGLAELEEAADLSPDNPTYRYHLAVAYSETGGVANAREQLQQALASQKVFADRANAEQLAARLNR